eukprot:TRINITY_DN108232_c0_g1_i1.p1 TRINITY_DN108232_c0_g1~~TRINITY_DN108232_c0_g1_i1.p1  ORF type:complete len:593 (-),score=123.22 TRINITY_DN108232_c0_g1_i1:181-1959(-)
MPPKGRGEPKPAEFHIAYLQAGKKQWNAGESGPPVILDGGILGGISRTRPRKEVSIVGKALYGMQRFAFEVQHVDYSPAAVRKVLKKQKALQDARFGDGGGFFGIGGDSGEESDNDRPQSRGRSVDFMQAFQAAELAAKHSIQVKFEDIDRIEKAGDRVTLVLSKKPQCYVKPEGEPRTVNMEVSKDITGGAKTITFIPGAGLFSEESLRRHVRDSKAINFTEIQQTVMDRSPRLAALFAGLPPPTPQAPATPSRKKKRSDEDGSGSTAKQPRKDSTFVEKIAATRGTWLHEAIGRFGLKGILDAAVSDQQWAAYFKTRVMLELSEVETLMGEQAEDEEGSANESTCESIFAGATWPEKLGPEQEVPHLHSFESYKDGSEEEREFAAEVLAQVRASVKATVASSALKLDPEVVARGVFLTEYHINEDGGTQPRTVNASARVYAPNGTGRFVELFYENHQRARMSFMERHSYLHVVKGGPNLPGEAKKREKVFELDFNECRRKNQTKTSLASNAVLSSLGAHLFGAEDAMSNRKVFGILVRAVSLGKFGENNGWPIAVARRRFKCGKEEGDTDTESIAGDTCEDASVDGCCLM